MNSFYMFKSGWKKNQKENMSYENISHIFICAHEWNFIKA